ncbi:hypothetical protein EVJ58_g8918 [Rhodofomes roseus]|uniref:SAP domain-containing protein n=1 Tax=Rhodofomes roseus TaxID=34475 RepID=A0A4Y9XW46_9APHY|nr:hypothetical protein EVJ58_g8918 [Rhodofomes roseus]
MHNQYLGLLKTHCRDIWGMDIDLQDGDGTYTRKHKMPPVPSETQMEYGLHCLYNGTIDELEACSQAVLWHLCFRHDLRRSRSPKRMLKTLQEWRLRTGRGSAAADDSSSSQRHATLAHATRVEQLSDERREQLRNKMVKAEAAFLAGKPARSLQASPKDVLTSMCIRRGLPTSGVKAELAERLVALRDNSSTSQARQPQVVESSADTIRTHPPAPPRTAARDVHSAVLGRTVLAEISKDMESTEVPAWVDPAPRNMGTKQRGKLSADQWFSACTINFVFTLVRLWGNETGRKRDMLSNYMDLVTAVVVSSMLEINEDLIQLYETSIMQYLTSLKQLYKEAEIVPNHHLAMHVGAFLRAFGPVHSIRTFFSERMNFVLQSENTNGKFGTPLILFAILTG